GAAEPDEGRDRKSSSMNECQHASLWATHLQLAASLVAGMSRLASQPYAEAMTEEYRKLSQLPVPLSKEELELRQSQSSAFTAKINAIAFAKSMAAMRSPAVADKVREATRQFCADAGLDDDTMKKSWAFTSRVQSLCYGL